MNNLNRPYNLITDGAVGMGDGVRSQTSTRAITAFTAMYDGSRNLMCFKSVSALNWSALALNNITTPRWLCYLWVSIY